MSEERWSCKECLKWIGATGELLTAPNPFDPDDTIYGCPQCKSIDSMIQVCDEPGCTSVASGGTPHPGGYKMHCHKHPPTA